MYRAADVTHCLWMPLSPVQGEGRRGCAVHNAPWDDVSFFSHYIYFFHRMGAHVCVCPFMCGVGWAHQVFPGGTRRKYQPSTHYVTASPNLPPLLYQVQGHHQVQRRCALSSPLALVFLCIAVKRYQSSVFSEASPKRCPDMWVPLS